MVVESKQQIRETSLELLSSSTINHPIGPLTQRAMFWRPAYLENSAWIEHIPFAFWLVEAHRPRVFVELGAHWGVSYFAFCQAVEKLELDARCFAVDTWKGDEQAGFYDERVFEQVKAYNEAQYSGFSRLVRSVFDDALPYFSDGSIDLLHIDGLHTFETASHDFEFWLPKLSERAVVVMHDTNVRERKFGVFKLFESLKERYSAFEFIHGHGLGVLKVGPRQTDQMLRFFRSAEKDQTKHAVHEAFSRLGQACGDSFSAAQQKTRAHNLKDKADKQKKQLEEAKQGLEQNKTDLHKRTKELADIRNQMQTQFEQHAVAREQLDEQVTLLQETDNKQQVEIKILEMRLVEAERELAAAQKAQEDDSTRHKNDMSSREAEVERLTETTSILQQELDLSQGELAGHNEIVERLEEKLAKQAADTRLHNENLAGCAEESERLNQALVERENELIAMQHTQQVRAAEMVALQQDLECRLEEIGQERWYLGERDAEIDRLTETQAVSKQELEQAQNDLIESNEAAELLEQAQAFEIEHLQQEKINQLNDNERLQWYLGEREAEIGRFTETLAVREQELDQAQNDLSERNEATKRLQQTLDEHIAEAQTLNEALAEKSEENDGLTRHLSEQDKALNDARELLQTREEEVVNYELERKGLSKEIVQLEQMGKERERELDEAQTSVNDQLKKLAKLTKIIEVAETTLEKREDELAQLKQLYEGRAQELYEVRGKLAKLTNGSQVQLEQTQQAHETLESANKEVAKENELLLLQLHQVQEELETTFLQIQQLEQAHTDQNTQRLQLQAQFEKLTKARDAQAKQSTEQKVRLEKVQKDYRTLEEANKESSQENKRLLQQLHLVQEELEETFLRNQNLKQAHERLEAVKIEAVQANETLSKDLHHVREELSIKEGEIEKQHQRLTRLKQTVSWKITAPLRAIAKPFKRSGKQQKKMETQVKLLKTSGLFDEAWYLDEYSDVASEGTDPVEHYLRHGAAERRNPSPVFNTQFYLESNPDVAATEVNPLVHFVKFGRAEGRTVLNEA